MSINSSKDFKVGDLVEGLPPWEGSSGCIVGLLPGEALEVKLRGLSHPVKTNPMFWKLSKDTYVKRFIDEQL